MTRWSARPSFLSAYQVVREVKKGALKRIGAKQRGPMLLQAATTQHGNLPVDAIHVCQKVTAMSEQQDDQERPCLHCMMIELIDQFFEEYPATVDGADTIDTDEVLAGIAKTVAELTCSQSSSIRQQIIEKLMREIMDYDAEFRQDGGTGAIGSDARH